MRPRHRSSAPTIPGAGPRAARRLLGVAAVAVLGAAGLQVVAPAVASAYPSSAVSFSGHGYGHGRGMGQYGAYGYAKNYGWNSQQILAHYYGGTTLSSVGNTTMTVRITARDGAALGQVTSGRTFTAGGVTVSAGSTATISRTSAGFVLTTSYGCGQAPAYSTPVPNGDILTAAFDAGSDRAPLLQICGGAAYRGNLSLVDGDGSVRTVNTVGTEDYLRGVVPRESPSSWGDTGGAAALEAQAVAARSYGLAQFRYPYAKTCDTQACQVYGGATGETPQAERAIDATGGVVLVGSTGRIVSAEFSSSTGGWTAGGAFPAVVDDGDTISPFHSWTTQVPVSTIEAAYGVGTLLDVRVTQRNGLGADGGRVLTVQVVGTTRTVTTTGDGLRIALGLRSNWYTPQAAPVPTSNIYETTAPGGPVTAAIGYGSPGDVALSCDWDGNGTDTVGVFRRGTWYLRNSNTTGGADVTLSFGSPGDIPICGDFDGNGTDTVGVYRAGTVYLRNSNTTGPADVRYAYGQAGDVPVVGDWDGDGTDTIGVFRAGVFYLSNARTPSRADGTVGFGSPGDKPVVGDWNGDGFSTPGVVRAGRWYITNSNLRPTTDASFYLGNPGDQVLSGHFAGGRVDGAAVARW